MPDSLYDSWTDITPPSQPSFDSWTDITPQQPTEQSWWNWANDSWLPQRESTVPEFQNTLKNFGVENQSIIDAASYLPRFGDWAYEKVARPTFTPLGAATLPATSLRAGRIGLAAVGAGLGTYNLTQEVPEFLENPSFEGGLDIGLNTAMAASPYIGYKTGAFKTNAKPGLPLESGENYSGVEFGGKTYGFKSGPKEPVPPTVVDENFGPAMTGDIIDSSGNPVQRSVADLPAQGETSPFNNKPYTTDIVANWIDVTPSAAPEVPSTTTFNTGSIDPNTYMTLLRELGRNPTMAELEAAATPATPDNVVPFTPRPTVPPETQLDSALLNMGAGNRMPAHNQEDPAWEDSLEDNIFTGPSGVVARPEPPHVSISDWEALPDNQQPPPVDPTKLQNFLTNAPWEAPQVPINPDIFSDNQARQIVDRAFPPPTPEPQPATEYGQSAIDQEALQWMRGQDRVIADYQAANGPLMGPTNEPVMGPMNPLTQGDLGLNQRTVKRMERAMRPSVPDAPELVEPINGPGPEQEPLPFWNEGEKRPGPGATEDEMWMELIDKLGRPPTTEEYLNYLRNGMDEPPRTMEEARVRRAQTVEKVRAGFQDANGYGAADFILPDGSLKAHNDITHNYGARKLGTSLNTILDAGVVRFAGGNSAEVNRPITNNQARSITWAGIQHRDQRAYVDVNLPGGDIVSRTFSDRALNPNAMKEWVNSHFPNEMRSRGQQQTLPGVPTSDIPPRETPYAEKPGEEVFKNARQLELPFDYSVVERFRDRMKVNEGYRGPGFMLPDGTLLQFNPALIHHEASRGVGVALEEAVSNGIMRYRDGAAEVHTPITIAQARQLIDARDMLENDDIPVEIHTPDGKLQNRIFNARAKASTIFNWVNSFFKESEITKTVLDQTKRLINDDTGAMPIPSWKDIKNKTGIGMGRSKQTGPPPAYNALHEIMMLPGGATTTLDFSAPGRQGLGLIHTPQFWKAMLKMPQGLWAPQFDKIDANLRAKQIFQSTPKPNGRPGPSFAEQAGLELMVPASSNTPGPRAQSVASKWLETGGFLGPEKIFGVIPNVPRSIYKHTAGYPIRATNRAYITFLNSLRANRFEYLINRAEDMAVDALSGQPTRYPGVMGGPQLHQKLGGGSIGLKGKYTPQEAMELHPYKNLELAKEIADFVNTATGAGPLKTHILPHRAAELNLEQHAEKLAYAIFSPGLMASRIRMLNPNTYVMSSPYVRKEYMKSALATAGAWFAFTTLLKLGADAMGLEAEVNDQNLTSADFGKVRIGELRLDPAGGFQQFLVNYARAFQGGWTSSANNQYQKFGAGFRAETQRSNIERFFVNKLQPVAKFAYDLADADAYQPFHVYDRMAQLSVSLYLQDIYEIVKENPLLLPIAAPSALLGFGTQMYGKGESVGKLVDPENDWIVEGGSGIRSVAPWNWGKEDYEMTDFPWSEPE